MGIRELTEALVTAIDDLASVDEKISALNATREALHAVSPMKAEPVDLVVWVRADDIRANDYNPNTVAPPEMALLAHSIRADGYTQPVVAFAGADADDLEVVDGFHRRRVGCEQADIRERVHGRLPIVRINGDRGDRGDRIASTVRHNRARGTHGVTPMQDLVMYLEKKWDTAKISKELGMDSDEVLRLRQVGGLARAFADEEFSNAWTLEVDET